jgi:hypothetical protein
MKFALICLLLFAVLSFLRFCEGSPIRTWKAVAIAGVFLSFVAWHYLRWAFPAPPPPPPREEKIALNKAELERTFRRIAGVRAATIEVPVVRLDFSTDKTVSEFRHIAQSAGATAAHFLSLHNTNRIVVFITVNGHQRYSLAYDTQRGVVDETY